MAYKKESKNEQLRKKESVSVSRMRWLIGACFMPMILLAFGLILGVPFDWIILIIILLLLQLIAMEVTTPTGLLVRFKKGRGNFRLR